VTRTEQLPLERPVAAAGAREGIWVEDAAAKMAVLFDAASLQVLAQLTLDSAPVGIATTSELVAVALEDGGIAAFGSRERARRWRRSAVSGDLRMAASRDRVWTWDRGASAIFAWDLAGTQERFDAPGATAFAAGDRGVYWLNPERVVFHARGGGASTSPLFEGAAAAGAMLACANSLWISAHGALLLLDQHTLEVRAMVRAPEGPVPLLVCHHGRIFGGLRTVFALEPAADDNVKSLGVAARSPLCALAVSGTHIWAVESSEPTVHVVRIP
jgi:hypothetical protein